MRPGRLLFTYQQGKHLKHPVSRICGVFIDVQRRSPVGQRLGGAMHAEPTTSGPEQKVFIEAGAPVSVAGVAPGRMRAGDGALELPGGFEPLFAGLSIAEGDFRIEARLTLPELAGGGASLLLEGEGPLPISPTDGWRYALRFCFDAEGGAMFVKAPACPVMRRRRMLGPWEIDERLGPARAFIQPGQPFRLVAERRGESFRLEIDGRRICRPIVACDFDVAEMNSTTTMHDWAVHADIPLGCFGFAAFDSRLRVHDFSATGRLRPKWLSATPACSMKSWTGSSRMV